METGKGLCETLCELEVGDEWHSKIYGGSADDVVVGELFFLMVFGYIYYKVDFAGLDVFNRSRGAPVEWPFENGGLDIVAVQERCRSFRCVEFDL